MSKRRVVLVFWAFIFSLAMAGLPPGTDAPVAAEKLPARLTDQEFWRIASDFSEPSGTFHSENLVSNEARFQAILPRLTQMAAPGRAFVGVGSEQNFTYILAIRPVVAFIVDLRRGNLDLHLAYKALFELSADRADFVSRLFSRPRPAGLGPTSTAAEIFAAYNTVVPSKALYDRNLKAIETQLVTTHGFALSTGDREGLAFVYSSWFDGGPAIRYQLNMGGGVGGGRAGGGSPTYADLMTASDDQGRNRSYLATEDNFKFVKDLEVRNMIVPVVGNFAGPKALRAVAKYLKQKEQIVSAFYLSNVEQYLRQDGIWDAFCANAATLPLDRTSTFIRSTRGGFAGPGRGGAGGGGFALDVGLIQPEFTSCAAAR
jgi:hypothetical protein